MPFKERQELVDILNSADTWRNLGGYYMNYSPIQLDKFAMQIHKPGGSPADALLSFWGQRNHTVLELWNLLRCVLWTYVFSNTYLQHSNLVRFLVLTKDIIEENAVI